MPETFSVVLETSRTNYSTEFEISFCFERNAGTRKLFAFQQSIYMQTKTKKSENFQFLSYLEFDVP